LVLSFFEKWLRNIAVFIPSKKEKPPRQCSVLALSRKPVLIMNVIEIIDHFYTGETPLRRLLIAHSTQVRDKALSIAAAPACRSMGIDIEKVAAGAMLHDIGICECDAPGILCPGRFPYIAHGIIGAEMLRRYGAEHDIDMEPYARICERHTGAGITAEEVRRQQLPIPVRDYLPETVEEKLVCLADKFFSKSRPETEKPLAAVRSSLLKFGNDTVARFDSLCALFHL